MRLNGDSPMRSELACELGKLDSEIPFAPYDAAALAERLSTLGPLISTKELPEVYPSIVKQLGHPAARHSAGLYYVPQLLRQVVEKILEGRSANVVCDPWAGIGEMLATASVATDATKLIALTTNQSEAALGRVLFHAAEWHVGDPLRILESQKTDFDAVTSVVPFRAKTKTITIEGLDGRKIDLKDDLGHLILVTAAMRLRADGVGLFVVPASFFLSGRSALRHFNDLGLMIEGALTLPAGSFVPYTNILTYVVIVRKGTNTQTFVAQLSSDTTTNDQIISNLNEGKTGGTLELGRFVDTQSFRGLAFIRTAERLEAAEGKFGAPSVLLGELATKINLGRHEEGFEFQAHDNAIFLPLIGSSKVVDSVDELALKPQNYAQVAIDPSRSNAAFVARFLNSDLGTELREASKLGFIPKLNTQTLRGLRILVPDLQTQKRMLEIESRIVAEHNTMLGIEIELDEYRRELWSDPKSTPRVSQYVTELSNRISGTLQQHAAAALDQWFETLPFPLASILRAWQATPSQDYKAKYEHLLHFFEGTTEFISVILLSAFKSNEMLFETQRSKLVESVAKQKLSFQRASFGTWKVVTEYLSKQTRLLLSGDKDAQALCADIFADQSLGLPRVLSKPQLLAVISDTNRMRNDWSGHGGIVGQDAAKLRNDLLLGQVQLREVFGNAWSDMQLISALHVRPRRGVFENEVAILIGSNSEFLKETRPMATWLDVERLYLSRRDSAVALKLLPLVRLGPTPESTKNAFYFFSRLDKDGARFVSYHYADRPELQGKFDDAVEEIKFLTHVQ
jgi:hypothetical protein